MQVTRQAPQPLPKQWFGDYLETLVPACGQTPSSQQEGERGDMWPRSNAKGPGNPLRGGRESASPEPLGKTKWHSSLSPCHPFHSRGSAKQSTLGVGPFARQSRFYLQIQTNPSRSAQGSPHQDLSAKTSKPIMVRSGPLPRLRRAVSQPEAEPSRVTEATSGGATLLEAIPRPNTRLTTQPKQPSSLPGMVPYSPKERVPLPGDKPPIGKGGRPG
jgi:hypothetical protein